MSEKSIAIRDVVSIGHSAEARALEVAGDEGVVLGVSEDEGSGERWFAVQIPGLRTVMLPAADLTPTGRKVARDEIYTGDHLRVSRRGTALDESSSEDGTGH